MAFPAISQAITCDPGRSPVTIHTGLNPTAADLPPRLWRSGAATTDINQVTFQWLAVDSDECVCASEVTTTNYIEQPQGTINIADNRTGRRLVTTRFT